MTKAQKRTPRNRVLRCWPSKLPSVNLLSGDNFDPKCVFE